MHLRPTKKQMSGYEKLLTPALTPFNTASLSIKYSRRSAASLWPVNWCVSEINVSISPRGYSLKIQVQTSLSVSACADEWWKERHFRTLLLWVEEFSFIMYIYWCFWSLILCIRWPNINILILKIIISTYISEHAFWFVVFNYARQWLIQSSIGPSFNAEKYNIVTDVTWRGNLFIKITITCIRGHALKI